MKNECILIYCIISQLWRECYYFPTTVPATESPPPAPSINRKNGSPLTWQPMVRLQEEQRRNERHRATAPLQ